jgi:hypothetical protein
MGDDDFGNANGGKSDDGNGPNADPAKEPQFGNSSSHGSSLTGNQNN